MAKVKDKTVKAAMRDDTAMPDVGATTVERSGPTYFDSLNLSNKATLIDPEELNKRARRNSQAEKRRIRSVMDGILEFHLG